jgi:hypothetical protein
MLKIPLEAGVFWACVGALLMLLLMWPAGRRNAKHFWVVAHSYNDGDNHLKPTYLVFGPYEKQDDAHATELFLIRNTGLVVHRTTDKIPYDPKDTLSYINHVYKEIL